MRTEVLSDTGGITIARHTVPAGFDSAPLYRGLEDDMCPCEHWCYLAAGSMRYRFADGTALEVAAGDAFHVRGGHLADVLEDAELIEMTRSDEFHHKAAHLAK